jgi:hypothetical protein
VKRRGSAASSKRPDGPKVVKLRPGRIASAACAPQARYRPRRSAPRT